MSFHNTVLSQVLKMFPRLEFEKLLGQRGQTRLIFILVR